MIHCYICTASKSHRLSQLTLQPGNQKHHPQPQQPRRLNLDGKNVNPSNTALDRWNDLRCRWKRGVFVEISWNCSNCVCISVVSWICFGGDVSFVLIFGGCLFDWLMNEYNCFFVWIVWDFGFVIITKVAPVYKILFWILGGLPGAFIVTSHKITSPLNSIKPIWFCSNVSHQDRTFLPQHFLRVRTVIYNSREQVWLTEFRRTQVCCFVLKIICVIVHVIPWFSHNLAFLC